MFAQARSAPAGDVTIKAVVAKVQYCVGPISMLPSPLQPGPSDITLSLYLQLFYENHGAEPMIVPLQFRSRARMITGQQDAETITLREDPFDPEYLATLDRPTPPDFIVIPAGRSEFAYLGERVDVPVHSPNRQLLGKTARFVIVRDHGLIPPPNIGELRVRWRDFGVVWTGTQESEAVSISIPESPATEDCAKDDRF